MRALGKCEVPRRDGEFISMSRCNLPIYFDERLIHSSPQLIYGGDRGKNKYQPAIRDGYYGSRVVAMIKVGFKTLYTMYES